MLRMSAACVQHKLFSNRALTFCSCASAHCCSHAHRKIVTPCSSALLPGSMGNSQMTDTPVFMLFDPPTASVRHAYYACSSVSQQASTSYRATHLRWKTEMLNMVPTSYANIIFAGIPVPSNIDPSRHAHQHLMLPAAPACSSTDCLHSSHHHLHWATPALPH